MVWDWLKEDGGSGISERDFLTLIERKKNLAPKKGKSEMVVFVVLAKRRSFAWQMKWVNLFLASAKDFFSLVELSTKKAMR